MSLFGVGEYDEQGEEILDKILHSMIRDLDEEVERYVLISFDTDSYGVVKEIKGIIPAKGLDYYKEENWTSYIVAEYVSEDEPTRENVVSENVILLHRKPKIKRTNRTKDDEQEK